MVYFTNLIIIYVYFVILLLLFYRSKSDYFWFAFFLILFSEIGGLFPVVREYEADFQRLPIFSIGPVRIPFRELFIVVAFLKSLVNGKPVKLVLNRNYLIFIVYFIVLSFYSVFIGTSFENIIRTILHILPFSLFFTLPRLFRNNETYYLSFFKLVLSGMVVVIIAQIFDLFAGIRVGDYIKGGEIIENYVISTEEEILRLIYSPYLNLICLFIVFLLMNFKEKVLKYSYLGLIIAICFLSIFLSATRGWILSYVLMISIFMISFSRNLRRIFGIAIVIFVFVFTIYTFIPNIKIQTVKVLNRLESLELVVKGDITAGGTLSRVTERAPRVWNKFLDSPIWGFGISDFYYNSSDAHVGHHNILLQTGLVGYFLFLYFWVNSNYLVYSAGQNLSRGNKYSPAMVVFYIVFMGIFVIHSTSTQMFGFTEIGGDHVGKIFLLALFYTSLDFFLKRSINEEKNQQKLFGS